MSNTLKCDNPIQKPKKQNEILDDYSVLEAKNDYWRSNVFKWFILIILMISILCLVGCFLWKFFTDSTIQKYILNQITNNIVFIILSIFAILKINIPDKNHWG